MNSNLSKIIDAFADLRVLVIGDAMLDCYLEGATNRLCREAPVPIVDVSERRNMAGGAANAAVNAASLGAAVELLSVIGDDAAGAELTTNLRQNLVGVEHLIKHPTRNTLTKKRVVSGGQMLLRFDEGDADELDEITEQRLIEKLETLFFNADAVIVSDYASGTLTRKIIYKIAELQSRDERLLTVDSRRLSAFQAIGATVVKPNFAEVCKLLDCAPQNTARRGDFVIDNQQRILEAANARVAAVTLDTDGAIIIEQSRPAHRTYAPPRKFGNATGAGDTFVAALTLALTAGAHTPAAGEMASAAAALVVEKERTAVCCADELRERLSGDDKTTANLARLVNKVKLLRAQNQTIVFTNGCFDILHRGHITYLNRAKELGDVLIVGVNSDESVRRLKNSKETNRPINPLEDRLQVLSALSCVDYLIAFEENSPAEIITAVKPDIYVKGGDYTRETLPETQVVESVGGRIEFLPYLEDRSTTGIIERIRKAYALAS